MEGVRSAAAVCTSRPAGGGARGTRLLRDLLLLTRGGGLALQIGQRRLVAVTMHPGPPAPAAHAAPSPGMHSCGDFPRLQTAALYSPRTLAAFTLTPVSVSQ